MRHNQPDPAVTHSHRSPPWTPIKNIPGHKVFRDIFGQVHIIYHDPTKPPEFPVPRFIGDSDEDYAKRCKRWHAKSAEESEE